MTPKEKAWELFEKYDKNIVSTNYKHICKEALIQCALIAVDEMLNNFLSNKTTEYGRERYHYYQQVKQEIENL